MSLQHRDEGCARILTLDRPEARNALDARMRQELIQALENAQRDPAVGAVVITGAGKCFAAGADLRELLARDTDAQRAFLSPPHIYSTVEQLGKPVIAAINGHALGAGLELATACDVRIAHPKAKFGQPEVNLALMPGGGGTQRLVHLVGPGAAARMCLTGDHVGADEALSMRLVDAIAEDCVAAAVDLATRMGRHDATALAEIKAALQTARTAMYPDGLRAEVEGFLRLHARGEAKTRIQAFLE